LCRMFMCIRMFTRGRRVGGEYASPKGERTNRQVTKEVMG